MSTLTVEQLSPSERQLVQLSEPAKRSLLWQFLARDTQLAPPDDGWLVWMLMGGRGAGKTRAAAEDTAKFARENPGTRQAIVAPTFAVGRDVCVEGESGLLTVFGGLDGGEIAHWNRSEGALVLKNRSHMKVFSSSTPERLRGPQFHRAWCEEMASWVYLRETWDMLMFGLRLGHSPKAIVSTTPKPYKLIRDLSSRTTTRVTRDSTFSNAANLSPIMLEELRIRYQDTLLGRQELYGEIIDDVEGALWKRSQIELLRLEAEERPDVESYDRVAVAVDPAASDNEDSDETGIIVVGQRGDSFYVLADLSRRAAPEVWGNVAVQAYLDFQADTLVFEKNQGGDMVKSVLKNSAMGLGIMPNRIHFESVWASRGKRTRAEPVAVLYTDQGGARVHHVQTFPELEDQMCTWVPGESSPDRMDALVWGLTYLMDNNGRRKLRFHG